MAQVGKSEAYRERKRATFKRWYYRNREASRIKNKEYRERTGYREHQREYLLEKKSVALAHYGNGQVVCAHCGYSDIRALSIDHINGRNPQELTKRKLNGVGMYLWLIRSGFPKGYQTLCMNCQFIKRENKHEYSNQYGSGGKKRVEV